MLYQRFHILAFTAMALIHLSTAAHFDCQDFGPQAGGITCTVSLNSGNDFTIEEDQGYSCTHGGHYCAMVDTILDNQWNFLVNNGGAKCSGSCTPNEEKNCILDSCKTGCDADIC